jgi:hypothetical protein
MKLIKGILYGTLATTLLSACGNEKGKYDATGTFEATEVIVSSEASGKLIDFNVTEGDQLQQGKEVGYVDTVQLYLKKLTITSKYNYSKKSQTRYRQTDCCNKATDCYSGT